MLVVYFFDVAKSIIILKISIETVDYVYFYCLIDNNYPLTKKLLTIIQKNYDNSQIFIFKQILVLLLFIQF